MLYRDYNCTEDIEKAGNYIKAIAYPGLGLGVGDFGSMKCRVNG
jgi:hypothetical protein